MSAQTGDADPLPKMTTVSQHSFDLASEKELNKDKTASTLCRFATEICMYVIAHSSCEVDSRMLLSMYSLLFSAHALRWAQYDFSSDSDFVENLL